MNWLEIQFELGIEQITLYFYESNEEAKALIRKNYSTDRVVIIDYKTKIPDVCKYEIEMLKSSESALHKHLYQICLNSFDKHFNMTKGYTLNAHERLNTNDCYMHYRYEYEYVTNFDFDEIFFPREFSTKDFPLNDSNYCLKKPQKKEYNIYDYAKRMFNKYGSKVGCLLFEHVLFLNVDQEFLNAMKMNETSGQKYSLTLTHNASRSMFFDVIPQDSHYLSRLINVSKIFDCLKMINTRFEPEWNKIFAVHINNRDGKSIFNTNYTEGINQHFSSVLTPGANVRRVNIEDGYSSHYREYVANFFFNQHIFINSLFTDLEYFMFFINL